MLEWRNALVYRLRSGSSRYCWAWRSLSVAVTFNQFHKAAAISPGQVCSPQRHKKKRPGLTQLPKGTVPPRYDHECEPGCFWRGGEKEVFLVSSVISHGYSLVTSTGSQDFFFSFLLFFAWSCDGMVI